MKAALSLSKKQHTNITALFLAMVLLCTLMVPMGKAWGQTTVKMGADGAQHILPFNNYYHHSWNQMIYTAEEIGGAKTITAISFLLSAVPSTNFSADNLTVYMGHTTLGGATGENDLTTTSWVPSSSLTQVYTATNYKPTTLTTYSDNSSTNGWITITLNTSFSYNGTDNLAIVIAESNTTYTSGLTFKYITDAHNLCLYRRSDSGTGYDSHPGSASGTLLKNRPVMKLCAATTVGDVVNIKKTVVSGDITFVDEGGSGGDCSTNYASGNYYTLYATYRHIFTTTGATLRVTFSELCTESSSYDWMYVYDGYNNYSNVLSGKLGGSYSTMPGPYSSTGQSLTFSFRTDSSNDRAGWNATINRVPFPTLTYSSNPANGGTATVIQNGSTVSSGASIEPGTSLNISATANQGCTFTGWTVSGTGASVASSSSASTTLTMGTANTTLTANFIVPPANSTCSTATALPCGTSSLAGTTVGTPGDAHGIPGVSTSNYGVWYTFAGTGLSTTITTTSTIDDRIVVCKGSCGSFEVVVNRDGTTGSESVTFETESGATYYVYISHYSSSSSTTGTFTISRTCAPTVNSISAPAAVCAGNALSLTAPTVTNNGSSVTAQGWQYSSNNSSWNTFDPVTALPYSYNGYYLRYYATNAGGTTYSNTVQMTVNPLPVISSVTSNVTNNTICGEGNSATLTANSSNATSYSWSNGAGSGASVTVAPTSATTYTVTAAIGSCTATSQISIDVVKAPVITATPANTECITAGTQVTLKGGISLTDYEFSTGTSSSEWYTLTNTTNIMDGGTTTGDYALSTVHDIGFTFPFAGNTYTQFSVNSDGNLRLGSTVTGTGNYSTPFSSSNASSNNPKINGMGFDGFFDVSSYGNYVRMQVFGTSPNRVLVVEFKESPYSSSYRQYPWRWQVQLSENGTVQIVYASSSPSSYGVANQIGLCVDASDGWTISTTAHTATHFTNGTSTTNATTSSWPGANRYYRFTPPPTPTYAWSYSGTTGTASGSNYTVSPTALSSTYTLSATLNGCTLTDSKTVTTVPTLSNITSNAASNTICNGSSATLSASSNASSLSWNNGAGNGASVTASPSATTSYTVTASANGCTNTGSITITVNDVPTLTAISAPAAICAGNTLTLTAPTVTANGSTVTAQGWQYSANGSSNWNTFSTSTQVPYSYNGYYLRYYATNGCGTTYSNTVKMTVNDQPVISSVTSNVANNTICGEGNSATLTANSSNATSYSWSNGAGSGASVTVAPTSATTYTVTAAIGSCTTTGQIAIEVMKAPVITSTPASTECIAAGTQVTLKPSADKYAFNVTSGTYSSISGTSSVSGDDNYSSAVNIGFTFNYWGEDYTTAVISTNGFLKLGNGSNGLGNDLTSTSYYNYLAAFWDDLDANSTQYTTLGTSPNRVFVMQHNGYRHSDNTSNTFTYQIRLYETTNVIEFWYGSGFPSVAYSSTSASIGLNNYENGTNSFISVTPTGIGTATSSTTTSNNSIGTTQCDYLTSGTIYRFTPLPTPTYAWSYNGTAGTASGSKYTVSPTALSSTYTLSATLNGCTLTDSKTVTTTPVLNISSSAGNAAACGGSEVELSATSNASNFTWSDGAGTTATVTVHPEISTIYHVTASSGSCTTEGSVGVTVINNPTVTITPDPAETCIDGTAQMVIKANDNFSSTLADYEFSTGTSSQWLSPSFTTIYSSGQDDEGSSTYNIGFTFNFAGIDYTQFSVNTNGSVRLGASNDGGAHRNTPFSSSNAGSYSPKIIGVGRDLGTGTNGYVKYGVYGTQPNRILVCEFATGNSYSSSLTADVKWQVQLFETSNKVQIVYYSSNPSTVPSSYQIGMCTDATDVITINPSTHTTSTGTTSTTYSSWPGVNRYYRFTPPTPPAFAWSHTGTQGSESTDVITNDTYTVTPAAFRNAYTVTNSATGCSAHVTLDLMDAANITAENVTIDCGNSTTLTASGLDGVTYNWYSDAACSRLIQANNATLSTPVLNDNTTYYVKAVKGENCETQAKAVTVTVNKPSVSITELVDQTICDGESFTFNPQAMGNGELSYHWSNGNTTIGEDPTYAAATAGTYLVTVTSTVGNCSVTENTSATLTVNDIPSLTAITAPAPVHYGSTLSLTAPTVTDNGSTVTAQGWEICATQDGNYTAFDPTTTVGFTQDGYFLRYYATNSCGTTVSNAVQITINKPILTTSVSPSNSGSITCSPMSDGGAYDYGTSVQLTATPSTGYTFQNWTIDGSTVTGNPATITMDADHNVVSNFTLNSHNVTYTYTGTVPTGAPAVPAEATYNYGATVPAAAVPTLTGYTFSGWSGEVATMPDEDVTVTGYWTVNSYTLTVNYNYADNSQAAETHTETVNYGATYSVASPAITGYTPSQATVSGTMPAQNVTVDVTYNVNSYTLTVNYRYAGGTQAAETHTETVNYGATYSVASPAITGYTPDQATVSGTMPAQNVTVDVTYNVNSYTLTVNYRYAGGTQAAETHTEAVNYGATYSVASPAITGYTPSQATVSGTMPAQNVTVDVTYNVNSYTLTVNYVYAGGTQAAETHTETVNYGATYSVVSPAITGYTPDQATVSGTMPAQNVTVDVTYNVNSYTLTVNYRYAGGTQAAATHTETVNYGATYSVASPAITGYTPDQATVSGTMPAQNVTVDVTYNVNSYTIAASANPAAGGSVTGAGTYGPGTTATLTATANNGYIFTNWTEGDEVVSTNATYTISDISSNHVLVAHFGHSMGLTVTGGNWIYNGQARTATVIPEVTEGTTIWYRTSEEDEWSSNVPSITDAGSITVYVKASNPDYADAYANCTLTINAKAVTITVTNASKTYGATDPAFTGTVTGLVNDDDLGDITYSRTGNDENAGTYTAVLTATYTANSNYTVIVTKGKFTINPKAVTITVNNASKAYGANDPAFTGTVEGLVNANDLGNITYSRTNDDENAGTYTGVLTANYTANNNYTVTVNNGNFTITPIEVTVTIVGASNTTDYDGEEHSVSGYTATANSDLYDVDHDFTFSGTAAAARTDAGTNMMGLRANRFTNTNPNFTNVTFEVTDGYITISPIEVTVTIVGYNTTVSYDGAAHSVNDFTVTANSALYDVEEDFTFSGNATATRTDAGTTYMGLNEEQFENNNDNFDVTFAITDGYIIISPATLAITVTGNTDEVVYNGSEQSVTGYRLACTSSLFDESKVVFEGNDEAVGTNVNTYPMGLSADLFSYNDNNINATFSVTDGKLTITQAALTITVTGNSDEVAYNGNEQSVTGYELACESSLYDATKVVFEGDDEAAGTTVGTYPMGLTADMFTYEDDNINATFSVTDGKLTITPAALTITVTGNTDEMAYNGSEQSVTGYTLSCTSNLYDATKVVFEGDDEAAGTTIGEYAMGLTTDMFTYEDDNINATFSVTDGKLTITPAALTITVTGNTDEVAYNGSEQSVTGYTLSCTSNLYDATKVVFEGDDEAAGTNVGEYEMGLTADMFSYNDANIDATFRVTDGKLTITPAALTITVTGNTDEMAYNGSEQSVTGYTLSCTSNLYDATKVVFEGDDEAAGTTIGEYAMGLTTDMFTYEDDNFANVTFNVTDGKLTITSIDVTVTITGANNTVDYDGAAHRVTGYTATANNDLYNVEEDFTFTPAENAILVDEEIAAIRTDAGTTYMGLAANQFANTNTNFNVTFRVTDGYITITPIDVTVTITGANNTVDYDGAAHRITGYTATASNDLYNVEEDFTFTPAENAIIVDEEIAAIRTDAGTTYMGLADNQFANTNTNFAHVTFDVTDGYITITPIDVTVTITGANNTVDYDGAAHRVTGYTATANNDLYNVEEDFTFTPAENAIIVDEEIAAIRTDAGTTYMGLADNQFANTNTNFAHVTFDVTDGYITITPIDVTVTIVGNNGTADYDGAAHSVSGYTATASSNLYDVDHDFTFSGTATASRTDAGTTNMGLDEEQFENTNTNFANVTFEVTDGYQKINPIDVTVTIVGNNGTADYDGAAHSVSGYTATAGSNLYDVDHDFTFSGTATASRTDAGTTHMGLDEEQFENTNTNFANVTFNVTDGYITINAVDVVVTIVGDYSTEEYDGEEHTVTDYTATANNTLYDVTRDFTFSGTATASRTDAGTTNMGLNAEQFTNTNENFTSVTFNVTDGYITVSKKAATIAAVNNGKVYGDAEPTLTAEVTGAVDGETLNYFVTRATGENVGEYAITVTPGSNPNYDITTTGATFTVTKATATVTANDNSKTYGTANDPALTATVTGLQNGDAASVISYTVSREAGEYVGDYAITPSGAAVQGNYDVEYVAGIFSILPTVEITTTPMPTAICSGSELTVAFDATIAGNNGTMSFAWSRNHTDDVEGTANGTGNINVTLTADATQTVTFTVTPTFTPTEGEAVEGTAITFDVTVNALPSVTEVANNVSCTEMGSAIITVTSEGSTFTCAWNNGAAAALTQQDNNGHYYTSFTNLSEGQFPYAITDANQCVTTGTITIEDPGRIFGTQSIASSTTDETCENIDLEIAINLMGGTPDYTLQWINVDNDEVVTETVTDNRQATLNLGRLPVGEYHLAMFIRDHFGCTGIASDTLTLVVKPIRTIVREVNIGSDDATYVYNGHTYNADEVPPTETYTGANGCDSIISYAVHSYPLDILVADKCTMTRSSYTKAYANNARLIGDTIYVKRNTATTFYAFIENTTANTWNEHKMDMRYELLFNEGTIANAEMPSLVSNFSISTYYDRTGTYYGIDNLTASTGEIPNNTLAFRQTANSTILHYDFFYFDAFKDIPNKVTFTGLQNGTYTFKLKAEDRHSSGGTNRTGIYNPYVVNRKFGHIWGGYNDRPGNREVLAARTFTVIVNETGTAPSHAQACTGISEYSNEPSVTTFPNPVNDQLNIRISGMSGATAITITDAQGRVVRTINTELYGSEEVLTYSVADFAQGIYFLNVRNSDTVVAQKFVVTKR